jgi:CHAT domain-containing protein/Tfp pilus assembly protein PilF
VETIHQQKELKMKKVLGGLVTGYVSSLLFLLPCFGQMALKAIDSDKVVKPLEIGQSIEREMPPQQRHTYKIKLEAGQFARIEARQRGCDVVFSVLSPEGRSLLVFENNAEGDGTETAAVAAETSGEYEIRLMSMHGAAASGVYVLRIAEIRPATEKELNYTAGIGLFNEAFRTTRENATADSLRIGIVKFGQAAEKLHLAEAAMREGIALRNVGDLYDRLGNRTKGIEFKDLALERFRKAEYKYGEFWVFRDLGNTYLELGEIEKSLAAFLKAVDLFPELEYVSNKAETLSDFGKFYERLGDLQRAVVYYTQALEFARQEKDMFPIYEANVNNNLGQVFWLSGETKKAQEHFQKALETARAAKNLNREAAFLSNLSKTHFALGMRDKAFELLQESLRISRSLGDRLGEAATLKSLGQNYFTLGKTNEALEALNQSLQIYRSVEDRQNLAETLLSIGKAEAKNGNFEAAQGRVEEAISLVEATRARVNVSGLRDSFSANLQDFYGFYVELLMQRQAKDPAQNFAARAFETNERGRARGLLNLLVESNVNIREGVEPKLLQKEVELKNLLSARLENLTKVLGARAKPEETDKLKIEIEQIRAEYEQTQTQIRQTSPRYSALTQPKTLDVKEIQTQVLDDDSVLLEYALGETRSHLWIVAKDEFRFVELPAKSEIDAAARRYYEALTARNKEIKFETVEERNARILRADAALPELSRNLSRMILAPAAGFLSNKKLLVVADGALQYIPFAALVPDPAASERFLVEKNEIVNLPSASVLTILRKETENRARPAKTLAVLADPIFNREDERFQQIGGKKLRNKTEIAAVTKKQTRSAGDFFTRDSLELTRLPFTRREAELITSLVPAKQQQKLLDFSASRRSAMSSELSNFRFVHFATHGFINNENPELSGIVLSMFDENGAEQEGFLRVGDIYNLKLPAEMVVLSGCKTGLGKEIKGEGLVGMTRGFIYAGAKRVTVSLWDVNDEATAELMGTFYREMLGEKKLSPAAALRQSQIAMLKDKRWSNPYFWATFILQGEPR